MKNITKLLAATFSIGLFCTMNFAQTDAKPTDSVKDKTVNGEQIPSDNNRTLRVRVLNVATIKRDIKRGEAGQQNSVIFCLSSDENTPASYRLKVWQLMQGQTAETAMASNKIIATASYHAINTKGAGANDRSSMTGNNSDAIKACSESLQQSDDTTQKSVHPHNGGLSSGNRESPAPSISEIVVTRPTVRAFVIDNFPVCAKGSSCDCVGTLEELGANGNPLNSNAKIIGFKLSYTIKEGFKFEWLHDK
jgi:hypothetical protein